MNSILPPGQQAISDFPRFGPPSYAQPLKVESLTAMTVTGDVGTPFDLALEELSSVRRQEQESDLHCVATWSRCGLKWGGYRFRDVYQQLIVLRARPSSDCRYVLFRGLDGFWASLTLEDALTSNVLLADELEGQPLSVDHGAPIRLVAPKHYAYKSVKHLIGIELYLNKRPGGTLKKCVNSQAVYPLSEQDGLEAQERR